MRRIGCRIGWVALSLVALAGCDLEIVKVAPTRAVVNAPFPYVITVSNRPDGGGNECTRDNVQVADVLAAGVELVSFTASQGTCAEASGTVTCAVGTLAISASATITLLVRASQLGTVFNTASVTSDPCGGSSDPNPDNDTSTAQTEIVAAPAPALSAWGVLLAGVCLTLVGLSALRRRWSSARVA